MLSNDGYARNTYERIYKVVAKANNLINFDINKLDNAAANQVEANYYVGQAYALRALGFFDTLRALWTKIFWRRYGYCTSFKIRSSCEAGRSSVADAEKQIESDFNNALQKMTASKARDNYANKTELSINGLKGLMARYYLYKKILQKLNL